MADDGVSSAAGAAGGNVREAPVARTEASPAAVPSVPSSAAAAAPGASSGSGPAGAAARGGDGKNDPDGKNEADGKADGGERRADRGKRSNRQRRNDKWKGGWRDKKKKWREANADAIDGGGGGGEGDKDRKKKPKMNHWKKEFDGEKAVAPHEGSFAHEDMRKLFDVDVNEDGSGEGGAAGGAKGDNAEDAAKEDNAKKDGAKENGAEEEEKVPKKKLAMLVSFLGSRYSGFQINAGKRTLHAELELGLHRAGMISDRNFGHPSKYSWSNSARTDKGVHAAAQACSFKAEMIYHNAFEGKDDGDEKRQFDAMRDKANECLPDDVRVLDFRRVTRAFCARTSRDKVRYQYVVPSYALCPREEVARRTAFPDASTVGSTEGSGDGDVRDLDAAALSRARDALASYRVPPEQMERLNAGLKVFEGTHPFHNYTRRLDRKDASAARYIMSFRALDPLTVSGGKGPDGREVGEMQWIPLQIVGQSFLLNQIRKMVSAAVDYARGSVSRETIERSLTRKCRMKVDVAPAQGLFLDRSYFELYNKHKVENAPRQAHVRDRETLDWVEVEGEELPEAVRRIEEFKNAKIIPHIVREEATEGNFLQYMHTHDVIYAGQMYGDIGE